MRITHLAPAAADLAHVSEELSSWQSDRWPGFLHPGDLGWHSMVGPERTAADLRVWSRGRLTIAIGMFDGARLLRMAVNPLVREDEAVADQIRRDLMDAGGPLPSGEAVVEVRGAHALQEALRRDGWAEDEPWTPLLMNLSGRLDVSKLDRANLRVESAGLEQAETWMAVHWSSFKGTPLDDETKVRLTERWKAMTTGPFAELAQNLIAFDSDDNPVAVTTVWTAGAGRPGLVEPMGVHREHQKKGYGVAITIAGAQVLQRAGASSAVVVAENSNIGALATYKASGFEPQSPVNDLRRPDTAAGSQ